MKVRLSNIQGMKRYLKDNDGMVQDITDKGSIGTKFYHIDAKDSVEIDSINPEKSKTKMVLISNDKLLVVTRQNNKVLSIEAVENNQNNHELIHKYVTTGRLDSYDEFESLF